MGADRAIGTASALAHLVRRASSGSPTKPRHGGGRRSALVVFGGVLVLAALVLTAAGVLVGARRREILRNAARRSRHGSHAHRSTSASEEIPRIVHQSWPTRTIPRGLLPYVESWRHHAADWEYRLWTDAANEALVRAQYSWLQPTYERLTNIQRADLARYLYMHAHGGVYADLDMELLQPLDPVLDAARGADGANASVVLGQEPLEHALLLYGQTRLVCNAILASPPRHPFWLFLLRRLLERVETAPDDDPVSTTGPRMLEAAVDQWRAAHPGADDVRVLAPAAFYPDWDPGAKESFVNKCVEYRELPSLEGAQYQATADAKAVCARLEAQKYAQAPHGADSYTVHHWVHTWLGWDQNKVDMADQVELPASVEVKPG